MRGPPGTSITLVVIHGISLPPGEFGGDAIARLFTNRLDPMEHPYYASIAHLHVSSHFLVRRDGRLLQFVSCNERAWHAGVSRFRGRAHCNDFSIGIELEGTDDVPYETAQYAMLARLLRALARRYPDPACRRPFRHRARTEDRSRARRSTGPGCGGSPPTAPRR